MNLKSVLMELYRDILKEVLDFNNIAILDYQKVNSRKYTFSFNDSEIVAEFQPMGFDELTFKQQFIQPTNNVINMSFSVDDVESQAYKTTLAEMLPIFNTLRVIAEDYVSNQKPDILTIISTSRLGGAATDKSKDRIYELLMRKHLMPGYGIGECEFISAKMKGFYLYKVKRKR